MKAALVQFAWILLLVFVDMIQIGYSLLLLALRLTWEVCKWLRIVRPRQGTP